MCTFLKNERLFNYMDNIFILFLLTVLICLKNVKFVIFVSWNLDILNVLGAISMKICINCRETLFQHIPAYF